MTCSTDTHQCDYLRFHSPVPVFTSERAELAHLKQELSSLEAHISELNALHKTLHFRSRQLHNSLAPICNLPAEVLSCIIQHFVDQDDNGFVLLDRQRLARAFTLSSVSSHFRWIAFDTPSLWKYIPLCITDYESARQASSLLQHCIALVSCVDISVSDRFHEANALPVVVDTLIAPDVARKIKSFALLESNYAPIWVDKLEGSFFPVLEALEISCETADLNYDFRTLKALTSLTLFNHIHSRPLIVPSSLQYLYIDYVLPCVFLSLLHWCPNLVQCDADFDINSPNLEETLLTHKSATLNHLKRIILRSLAIMETSTLMKRISLPVLETLELEHYQNDTFIELCPLLRNVSPTLTTLVINTFSTTLDYEDLYQMCRLPLPKLSRFEIQFEEFGAVEDALHALALLDDEYGNSATRRSPTLRIIFRCDHDSIIIEPRFLLDLLERRRLGKAFSFCIHFGHGKLSYNDWSPELRQELKTVVGENQVEVKWGDFRVVW